MAPGARDVTGSEPVHRQGMDEPQGHGLVRRPSEGCWIRDSSTWLQSMTALISGIGAEGRVLAQVWPVAVVGDETRSVFGDLLVEQPPHGQGRVLSTSRFSTAVTRSKVSM